MKNFPPSQEALVKYYVAEINGGHFERVISDSVQRAKDKIEAFRERALACHPERIKGHIAVEEVAGYPVDASTILPALYRGRPRL